MKSVKHIVNAKLVKLLLFVVMAFLLTVFLFDSYLVSQESRALLLLLEDKIENEKGILVQEIVNESYYAAHIRVKSIGKELKGGGAIVMVQGSEGKTISSTNVSLNSEHIFLGAKSGDIIKHKDFKYLVVHRDLSFGGEVVGRATIAGKLDRSEWSRVLEVGLLSGLLFLSTFFIVIVYIRRILIDVVVSPLVNLKGSLGSYFEFCSGASDALPIRNIDASAEIHDLVDGLEVLATKVRASSASENYAVMRLRQQQVVSDIAAQVSHDIRSPLTALNLLKSALKPGQLVGNGEFDLFQTSIERISDICSSMLSNFRTNYATSDSSRLVASNLKKEIPLIVREKNFEVSASNRLVEIDYKFDDRVAEWAMVHINPVIFGRILSNLLNNSVEAICLTSEEVGRINVTVGLRDDGYVRVVIRDNGVGLNTLSPERLFSQGASKGKSQGNGIGLAYARSEIEKVGGTIFFKKVDDGACLILELRRVDTKNLFVSVEELKKLTPKVFLDDDPSMHKAWESCGAKFSRMKGCYSRAELQNWLGGNGDNSTVDDGPDILCDYDLSDEVSGLELLVDLGVANRAVIVTSKIENSDVISSCLQHEIRIFPKSEIPKLVAT